MYLSSVTFMFVFLPIILIAYYVSPKYMKNTILLIMSLIFYGFGEPLYIVIILVLMIIAYFVGLYIRKYNKLKLHKKSTATLIIGISINMLLLVSFKYLYIFVPEHHITLPLGISVYTFQIMSYFIEVYRGDEKAIENPLDLGLYIAMFPQLNFGPISQYHELENQINYRDESIEKFATGIKRLIIGLCKVSVFVTILNLMFNNLSNLASYNNSVLLSWLCSFVFTLKIYFMFSGFSDMAIGVAKLFSFDLPENFNYPYISRSITEFWQRWNVSLVSWFKDYVYKPIVGEKPKKMKLAFATLLVWLLIGVWYLGIYGGFAGVSIWILIHCFLLINEKLWLGKLLNKMPKFIGIIYTLFFINLSFVAFSYNNFADIKNAYYNMFFVNGISISNKLSIYYILSYGVLLIIFTVATLPYVTVFVTTFMKTLNKRKSSLRNISLVMEPLFFLVLFLLSIAFMTNWSNVLTVFY